MPTTPSNLSPSAATSGIELRKHRTGERTDVTVLFCVERFEINKWVPRPVSVWSGGVFSDSCRS